MLAYKHVCNTEPWGYVTGVGQLWSDTSHLQITVFTHLSVTGVAQLLAYRKTEGSFGLTKESPPATWYVHRLHSQVGSVDNTLLLSNTSWRRSSFSSLRVMSLYQVVQNPKHNLYSEPNTLARNFIIDIIIRTRVLRKINKQNNSSQPFSKLRRRRPTVSRSPVCDVDQIICLYTSEAWGAGDGEWIEWWNTW